jgi:hypothetical protein
MEDNPQEVFKNDILDKMNDMIDKSDSRMRTNVIESEMRVRKDILDKSRTWKDVASEGIWWLGVTAIVYVVIKPIINEFVGKKD